MTNPTPSELVERVAKAICEADKAQWFKEPAFTNELFRKLARAAIAAMPASPVGQPVAWMYEREVFPTMFAAYEPADCYHGYTETPLCKCSEAIPAATVNALVEALEWALAEIGGSTRYANEEQFLNCCDKAHEALALVGGVSS